MKFVNVDVDSGQKSERQEWGRAAYHAITSPMSAFELEVQWLVATGCILGDLVRTSRHISTIQSVDSDEFCCLFIVIVDVFKVASWISQATKLQCLPCGY